MMILEPIDYVARRVNGKRHLPPLALRRYAGPLATIEASGAEFLAYLKLMCRATSSSRILDIGCGYGLMALHLEHYLGSSGSYVGVDINRQAIQWASRTISARMPNFEFIHLDIRNGMYNPSGHHGAEELILPKESASFDIVLLKSVFTHLLPQEVVRYLTEVARLLTPEGTCLATFFVLNDAQKSLAARGLNTIDFGFGAGEWRYAYPSMPELAIAYQEKDLLQFVSSARLLVNRTFYGAWTGRSDGLSYQDIVLMRQVGSTEALI